MEDWSRIFRTKRIVYVLAHCYLHINLTTVAQAHIKLAHCTGILRLLNTPPHPLEME